MERVDPALLIAPVDPAPAAATAVNPTAAATAAVDPAAATAGAVDPAAAATAPIYPASGAGFGRERITGHGRKDGRAGPLAQALKEASATLQILVFRFVAGVFGKFAHLEPPAPVRVEKCMAAIFQEPSAFETVQETLRGKAMALPPFFPLTSPDTTSQPILADSSPCLT